MLVSLDGGPDKASSYWLGLVSPRTESWLLDGGVVSPWRLKELETGSETTATAGCLDPQILPHQCQGLLALPKTDPLTREKLEAQKTNLSKDALLRFTQPEAKRGVDGAKAGDAT